jgi:hypothetical protein
MVRTLRLTGDVGASHSRESPVIVTGMASKRSSKHGPDHLLAPEQYPGMNRAFYATRPWEYFRHRQRSLLLAAGAPEKLLAIGREGVKVGALNFKLTDDDSGAQEEEDRQRYVLAESEVLMHHASETLLRLYLAHEGLPACPWLEMARVRSPGDFKKRVEKRFVKSDPSQHCSDVALVFFGANMREKFTPIPEVGDWEQGIANVESFLRHYARHFLDADVYNALKHGLAIQAGEVGMQLDEGDLIKAEGTALEFLSIRRDQHDRQRWNMTTRWIEVDKAMSYVYVATSLIESMWGIARGRYLGEVPKSINVWTKPDYDQLASRLPAGQSSGIFIDTVHTELLYYAPVPTK